MNKLTAFIVFILFQVAVGKLRVRVFFEALCPDSKEFVVNQLHPVYTSPDFKALLDLQLIPFGKASWTVEPTGDLSFKCQHGKDECLANTYLACSLEMYTLDQALNYTYCIMNKKMPQDHLESCAKELSLSYSDLKACQEDKTKGPIYLKKHGETTKALNPKLNFVPTVILGDVFNRSRVPELVDDFKKNVCKDLGKDAPKSC